MVATMKEIVLQNSPKTDITREGAMTAFKQLREQAKENGISEMTLDDINEEIQSERNKK